MHKKALRKIIEDFSNALEQGCGAVYRRNFDSDTYEYMGGYIEEITGYAAGEITPKLWDSLVLKEEQQDKVEKVDRHISSGDADYWKADVQIRTRTGEIRWVSDMSTALRDRSGSCFGSLGVMLDITARKEAEQQLVELTEKLRQKNQEMDAELAMAREVQEALISDLPDRFPLGAAENQSRVVFHRRYIPAEMLAGDFFDILPLSDCEVGVLICDVVGHGMRAALLTTFLRGLIEELRPHAHDPGVFLTKINKGLRAVFGQGEDLLFASAFYFVLKVDAGDIRYANAGHPSPLCLMPEVGRVVHLMSHKDEKSGPALGIIDGFEYATLTHELTGAESMLLYTDGLFEACNQNQEMYGEERMLDSIRKNLQCESMERMDHLIADIHRFTGSDVFEDDACLLAVVPDTGRDVPADEQR